MNSGHIALIYKKNVVDRTTVQTIKTKLFTKDVYYYARRIKTLKVISLIFYFYQTIRF